MESIGEMKKIQVEKLLSMHLKAFHIFSILFIELIFQLQLGTFTCFVLSSHAFKSSPGRSTGTLFLRKALGITFRKFLFNPSKICHTYWLNRWIYHSN